MAAQSKKSVMTRLHHARAKIRRLRGKDVHAVTRARRYRGQTVFTVRQLCDLLEMEIPAQYQAAADLTVDQTDLFQVLENPEEARAETRWVNDPQKKFSLDNEEYLKASKEKATSFKERYQQYSFPQHSDEDLLNQYVKFRYQFAVLHYDGDAYFTYRFFEKSTAEAASYISHAERIHFRNYRDIKQSRILQDKARFLREFAEFTQRDWLDTRVCTQEDFTAFVHKHPQFVGKPAKLCNGQGVCLITVTDDIESMYRDCKAKGMILEERIKQHPRMAAVNEDTVNTIRINTLTRPGKASELVMACVKFGRVGETADNGCQGGIWALVDTKTGKISTDALARNGDIHQVHPDSGVCLKGYQLPGWESVVATCLRAAEKVPGIHHIGWDVAISETGDVIIVEGNTSPVFTFFQSLYPPGYVRALYEPVFAEFAAARTEGVI